MSELAVTRTTIEGFDAFQIDTGALTMKIIPELGGKIASLFDLRNRREWLWRHPRMPYRRVPHGAVYTAQADTGGWDECFPSVSACAYPSAPWAGAAVQDHGELWSQTAALTIDEHAEGTALIRARWYGVVLPYMFERTIHLAAGAARARFEYTVINTSDDELHFIWSAHPLMAIEPGMRLLLPEQARFHGVRFTPDGVEQSSGLRFPLTVPSRAGTIDLATLPEPDAAVALKLWSEPLDHGWAALAAPDGEFRLRWDPAQLPQVAVWMNLGAAGFDGGAPYYNMGLEPCIGAQDSLADAVTKYRLFEQLPPRGSRAWWLEVELAA